MIVVIDDDEMQRALAVQYLDMVFGGRFRVRAYEPAEFENVDWTDTKVAIVDLMMPTPGTVILGWLKEHHPHVKRIAWSAVVPKRWGATNPIVAEARQLADEVISKLTLEDLAEAITVLRRDD